MIWPAECDDALISLRVARDELGMAVDRLHELRASTESVAPFTQAHEALSWAIDALSTAITHRSRIAVDAEAVEERHVDAQLLPWMENDDAW